MRLCVLFIFLCFSYFSFGQQSGCDKEITVFEIEQTSFTDARLSIDKYESYFKKNYTRLTPDCQRRMYSLLANFYYVGGASDTADNYFKSAIDQSKKCTNDTAKIYALIDYARFLNVAQPDSFDVYMNLAYEMLFNYSKNEKLKFGQYLSTLPPGTVPVISDGTELNPITPSLLAGMGNNIKALWRQYYELRGSSLIYSTKTSVSEDCFKMALFFDRNNPEDDNEAVSLSNLGLLLQNTGRHTQAVDYFLASIEKNKAAKEEYAMINTLINVAYSFRMIRRYEVARQYIQQAINISKQLNLPKNLCRVLSQYASVFIDEGNYTEAERVLKESISLSHSIANEADLCYSMRKLADMYINKTDRLDEGKQMIDSSAWYAKQIGDNSFFYYINNTLANYFFKKGMLDQSLQLAQSSYKESVAYNDMEITEANLKLLYRLYEKKQNHAMALEYYKMYEQQKDSSSGKEIHFALSDIQERYESQKKQLAIDNLEKEKTKKQQQNNMLIGGLGVLLLLSGFFYFFNRKLNHQKRTLQQTNTLLNEATATQNRLFGIIGHDLRGLVAPFSKAGKIMSNYISKNNMHDAARYTAALEENAGRLSETLNNLLHWSLQQMKGFKINKENVPVFKTVNDVVALYNDVLKLKNITVKVDVPSIETLVTDKEAFQIIIRNLLSNAIKFTEHNAIQFSSVDTKETYTITITDNGIGMTDEQVTRLFSLSEKPNGTGTQGETGSGLGLVVVQKMAEALNAQVKIVSEVKVGTSISIIFKK